MLPGSSIRSYTPDDLETWRSLLARPGIRDQYAQVQGPLALESKLADENLHPEGIRLAFVDDEPAGFAFGFVLPQRDAGWAMLRAAVVPEYRRRGIGEALLREVIRYAATQTRVPDVRTVSISAWKPCDEAAALADKLGFVHERFFWMMERPRGDRVHPVWPAGVSFTIFDCSDAHFEAWNDIYNLSFREHWRYVASSVAECRELARAPGFRADGLALAWRDGRCVGFCRCALHEASGEIEVLGTDPATRGLGVGRALLRWGVAWIESSSTLPVTLLVDGENESALRLYRAEGFLPARERRVWTLPADRLARMVGR